MKKTSVGNLIDLAALNKNIKKSSSIYWQRNGARHIISDGHWIVSALLPDDCKPVETLTAIFDGETPGPGDQMTLRGNDKGRA